MHTSKIPYRLFPTRKSDIWVRKFLVTTLPPCSQFQEISPNAARIHNLQPPRRQTRAVLREFGSITGARGSKLPRSPSKKRPPLPQCETDYICPKGGKIFIGFPNTFENPIRPFSHFAGLCNIGVYMMIMKDMLSLGVKKTKQRTTHWSNHSNILILVY